MMREKREHEGSNSSSHQNRRRRQRPVKPKAGTRKEGRNEDVRENRLRNKENKGNFGGKDKDTLKLFH